MWRARGVFSRTPTGFRGLAPQVQSRRGARRAFAAEPAVATASPPVPDKDWSASIFFGSSTGTAAAFAAALHANLEATGIKCNPPVQLNDCDVGTLPKEPKNVPIIVVANFGRGEPPDNAAKFYDAFVTKGSAVDPSLAAKRYCLFGLGSSQYGGRYQFVGRAIDARLHELGASPLVPRGEGDDAEDLEGTFEQWSKGVVDYFQAHVAPATTTTAAAGGTEADPNAARDPSTAAAGGKGSVGVRPVWIDAAAARADPLPPLSARVTAARAQMDPDSAAKFPVWTRLMLAKQLHLPPSERSCRHLEFDLTGSGLKYTTGDYLGVYAENSPEVVNGLAKRWDLNLDATFSLPASASAVNASVVARMASWFPSTLTVRELLTHFLDLTAPRRREFVLRMATRTVSVTEQMQLESLGHAARDDPAYDETFHGRPLTEIADIFPHVRMDIPDLLWTSQALQPRFYSISSSSLGEANKVDITVGRALCSPPKSGGDNPPPIPIAKRMRGLCSGYLERIQVGDSIPVVVKASQFRLPEDPTVPLLMVGAGTGMAPFRGFLQHRLRQHKELTKAGKGSKGVGPMILFYGCEHGSTDFFYRDELANLQNQMPLQIVTAFSHDQPERIFVQQRMLEHGAEIVDLLKKDGSIYICGHPDMGRGVEGALEAVLRPVVGSPSGELEKLKQKDRFHFDVFR